MSGHDLSSPTQALGSPSSSLRARTSPAEAEANSSPASARSREVFASGGSLQRKNRPNSFLLDPFAKLARLSSNKKRLPAITKGKEKETHDDQRHGRVIDGKIPPTTPSLATDSQIRTHSSIFHGTPDSSSIENATEQSIGKQLSQNATNGISVDAQARWKTDPTTLVNLALQLSQSRARVASTRLSTQAGTNNINGRAVSLNNVQAPNTDLDLRTKQVYGSEIGQIPAPVPVSTEALMATTTATATTATTTMTSVNAGGLTLPGIGITNGLGTQHQDSAGPGITMDLDSPATVQFLPSPQTTIRAERAKIALELRYHHRRLLNHIPALPVTKTKRPRLPGTKVEDGQNLHSSPGGGLVYNPLQSVRNRKTRYREQQPIDPDAQGWKDLDRVKHWVDEVVRSNQGEAISPHANPVLPDFESAVEASIPRLSVDGRPSFDGEELRHAKLRVPPPHNDWMIMPWELLADTYWLNQDGNKWLVQDRNGERIFEDYVAYKELSSNRHGAKGGLRQLAHNRPYDSYTGRSPVSAHGGLPDHETDVGSAPMNTVDSSRLQRHLDEKQPGSRRLSKRLSRTHALSSSSEAPSDELQPKFRPWSGTFGRRWQGSNFPSEKPGSSLGFVSRDDVSYFRSSSEVPVSHRDSKENRRPFPFDLQPPPQVESTREIGDRGEQADQARFRPASTLSDLESTGPDSPSLFGTFPANFPKMKTKKNFKHAQKPSVTSIETGARHHRIQRMDFADDPFRDDQMGSHQREANVSRVGAPLSSPSETSFSALSDDQMPTHLSERKRHGIQGAIIPERELGFRPLKPWKGGTIVGRARDLLRRKDFGSDTSDTGDESGRINERSPLSRATTSSSYHDSRPIAGESSEQAMENAQYKGPELPTFRSARQNGSPVSKDRKRPSLANWQKATDGSSARIESDQTLKLKTRPESASAGILSPPMSRTATEERSHDSSASQTNSAGQRRATNERRGATVTDTAGNQWPLKHRTDAAPWPGQDRIGQESRIIWTGPELRPARKDFVSFQDINRVRIILSSARFKANYILRYYKHPPNEPTALSQEITTYKPDQKALSRIEETSVLSQLLASEIDKRSNQLDESLRNFSSKTQPELDERYQKLKDHIQETLMDKVLAAGDGADNLGAQIAGECTLEVKHLNDRIDLLWRQRRRRSRWLRRILFTVLEWTLLSIMWALWFLVVCLKILRSTIKGTVASVRWLFWM